MSEIRKNIQQYFESKEKLDEVAKKMVNGGNIRDAAKQYGIIYSHLKQKVNIMRRLSMDFRLECALDRAVQNVLCEKETITEAAIHYKIDPKILSKQINQHKKLGRKTYVYAELISVNTKIFTYDEELLLLKRLSEKTKTESLSCTCQICAMILLLNLAYEFAQKENKQYPAAWNDYKQADVKWLIHFEMIHGAKLSILFDNSKKCNNKM